MPTSADRELHRERVRRSLLKALRVLEPQAIALYLILYVSWNLRLISTCLWTSDYRSLLEALRVLEPQTIAQL